MSALPVQDAARFRMKFTTVAHRSHLFCSPMSDAKAALLLSHLELRRGDRILDIGCGKAELLIRLVQQSGAEGVGVDRSAAFLRLARERARESGRRRSHLLPGTGRCNLHGGSRWLLGGIVYRRRSGFRFILPTWRGECPAWFNRADACSSVSATGSRSPPWNTCDSLASIARLTPITRETSNRLRQLQLTPLWSATSDDAEWDAYEELYRHNIEQYTAENPQDPDGPAMIERVRAWNRMYHDHGRSTLGFGFYLLRNGPPRLPE